MRKNGMFVFILLILVASTCQAGILQKPRVRIDDVIIEDPVIIDTNESFDISITIRKQRIRPYQGLLEVYLIYTGLPQKLIGSETIQLGIFESQGNVNLRCNIHDIDINPIQEVYNIKVILYEKKLFGRLVQRDISTLQSVKIISRYWEKEKIKIIDFSVPNTWPAETLLGTGNLDSNNNYEKGIISVASNEQKISVTILNDALCDFNVF